MNFRNTLAIVLACFFFVSAQASDLIYTGSAPFKNSAVTENSQSKSRNSEQIRYILAMEARVQTVGEAIELKTRGLSYVESLYDFEYLTSCPFASPSEAYIAAVANFIVQYVANYVYSPYDLPALRVLESRVPTVGQAIAVKTAGLRARLNIQDFVELIPPSIGNPSEAYLKAISTFTAQNIASVLNSYSPIYLIIEAEKYTLTVIEAMIVKNAGLVAVRNQRDLMELGRYSVQNPSVAYQNAVNEFLRANMGRYPRIVE